MISMKSLARVGSLAALLFFGSGCSTLGLGDARGGALPPRKLKADKRLAGLALDMLDPSKAGYNPDKGKSYLEYSLKRGSISAMEVPTPVLLELLRSEKVAMDKSRTLEQQLEIMKEIDLTRDKEDHQ